MNSDTQSALVAACHSLDPERARRIKEHRLITCGRWFASQLDPHYTATLPEWWIAFHRAYHVNDIIRCNANISRTS